MLQTTHHSPIPELSVWTPLVLAILRIVSALLLIDQGLNTLLHFPQAGVPDGLDAAVGGIEVVGGVLIAVGLYTRVAALAAAAESRDGLRGARSSRHDDPVLCHLFLPGVRGARPVEPGRLDSPA